MSEKTNEELEKEKLSEQAASVEEKKDEAPQPIKAKVMLSVMMLDDGKVFLNANGTDDKGLITKMLAAAIMAAVDYQPKKSPIIQPSHGKTPGAFGNPAN